MKLFLKDMNIQSTVTENPTTTFHLRNASGISPMDVYYINGVGKIYDTYSINNETCVIAYGSDDSYASSEALAYFLNFYVELYIISYGNTDTMSMCLTRIFWVLNTIIVLNSNITEPIFKNVIFPTWNYKYENGTFTYVDNTKQGSATDMNIEMLKSLLKLYIFDYNNPTLKYFLEPPILSLTLVGVTINKNFDANIILKKFIVIMTYNFTYGGPTEVGPATGNFSSDTAEYSNGPRTVCFWTSCSTSIQDPGNNLIKNLYQDYVNFSCFIYLYKFFDILGFDLTTLNTKTIHDVLGDGDNTSFPSWRNTKYSISSYLIWLNTNILSNGTQNFDYNFADGVNATFNRLSYQLIHLYILLNQGDGKLKISSSECTTWWKKIVGTTLGSLTFTDLNPNVNINTGTLDSVNTITSLCANLINYEIHNNALKLMLLTNSAITINNQYIFSPYIIGDGLNITSQNPDGYYRQLTYMCFKEIYNKNTSSNPSNWSKTRTDSTSTNVGDTKYFENNTLDNYFGFTSGNKLLNYSLQSIINTYDYTESSYKAGINYFGTVGDTSKDWKSGSSSWDNNNNNPYFMFSVCSLHQINYNLYKNPFLFILYF
jgi:hypothetical protein